MFKPLLVRWLRWAARAAVAALVTGPLLLTTSPAAAGPAAPADAYRIYLPLALNKPCVPRGSVIFGCLEQNGARVSGVVVTIRHMHFVNPMPPTIEGTAVSDAGGYFDFSNIPPLSAPDYYYAGYQNTTNPAQLSYRDQPLYYAGGQLDLGLWDITNIPLTSPADGAHSAALHTFTWTIRPSSPSDFYVLVITGYPATNDYYQQPVGHNGSVQFTGLPTALHFGTEYHWFVRNQPGFPYEPIIEDSFQMFRVTFDNPNQPAPRPTDLRLQLSQFVLSAANR